MAVDKLEIQVLDVRWKSADYVEPTEIDNCNTALNDGADGVANLAFSGVETFSALNDQTPSS